MPQSHVIRFRGMLPCHRAPFRVGLAPSCWECGAKTGVLRCLENNDLKSNQTTQYRVTWFSAARL